MIQEITCPDSFVSISNSTVPLRRLFQQHRSFASLRRVARLRRMSAMPSIATETVRRNEPTRWARRRHRKLFNHYRRASFDHVVGDGKHAWRYRQAECFRGLQIDHQLELAPLPDWKVGRFNSLNDLPDITAGFALHRPDVRAIGHQRSGSRKRAGK